MGKVAKTLLGIAAVLNVGAILAGTMPEPINYFIGLALIFIIIAVIADVMNWF